MNNGTFESAQAASHSRSSQTRHSAADDELFRTKRELLQAEVRLAKARATVVAAEIDIKILNARLKSLTK